MTTPTKEALMALADAASEAYAKLCAGILTQTEYAGFRAALASALAEVVKDAGRVPDGVIISAYTLGDRRTLNAITIQRVGQIEGPDLWAVRRNAECLAKTGEWEWEPMPSSRDDEFLARCRFDTHHAAIDAALAARSAEQKGV